MACGDNEFWEKIFNETEEKLASEIELTLRGDFSNGFAAVLNGQTVSNVEPIANEPTSREYVDQQVFTGDLHFDTSANSGEMLVFDGTSNNWAAVTNAPVTAITTTSLEVNGVDVLAKLEELDNMIQELTEIKHIEQIGEKICALADELDEQTTKNAFERAMKGI